MKPQEGFVPLQWEMEALAILRGALGGSLCCTMTDGPAVLNRIDCFLVFPKRPECLEEASNPHLSFTDPSELWARMEPMTTPSCGETRWPHLPGLP